MRFTLILIMQETIFELHPAKVLIFLINRIERKDFSFGLRIFAQNKFIAQLEVNKQLTEFIANQKRTWANDEDFVKGLYEKIVESDIYKEYKEFSKA